MYPDPEIQAVEERLAERRRRLARSAQFAKQRGLQRLASPVVLAGAAALGFLAAGGIKKREPKYKDRRKNTSKGMQVTGIASLLMTGAMWFIRARFGTPWAAAEYVLAKIKKDKPQSRGTPAAATPSPRSDSRMGQLHR
jgi:hypothetical protein